MGAITSTANLLALQKQTDKSKIQTQIKNVEELV